MQFLQGRLGEYSGKSLRRLLEANVCRINGRIERFGSRLVQKGDAVELSPNWKTLFTSNQSSLRMVYENEAFCIVDKPAGWVCLDAQVQRLFGPSYCLVHRLDKDTTGLLIVAKDRFVKEKMIAIFDKHEIKKHYLAVVDGVVRDLDGTRRSLLGKRGAYHGQTIWGSGPKGALAITHWERLSVGDRASLVRCEPVTGRTHQIRVHMAEMGHPILVDRQYSQTFRSPYFATRPLLHASRLQFSWEGEALDVRAPLPIDIREALVGCCVEMGHLSELFRKERHPNSRDESHEDENAKEVEKAPCFIHESCQ